MRELTLEELELVAGGTDTIVVTGDRGDSGDWGDYGDDSSWYDSGDYGDGGGGGGSDTASDPYGEEIVVTAPRPAAQCPVNDWWPNFLEDWGQVKAIANLGPWEQFWTDGYTWCFYDNNDNLMGRFVVSTNGDGPVNITFNGTDGDGSYSGGAYGFSGGYQSNDSNGFSYTINLTPAP